MQLSQSSLLLASILFFLSIAGASPLVHQRRPSNFVTLPIKRHRYEPNDLHPRIVTEQHVNRALQRLARMSGIPPIPREILERNLMRRVLEVEGQAGLEKRYNRRTLDDTINLNKRANLYDAPSSKGRILAAGDGDSITEPNRVTAKNSLGLAIDGVDVGYLATIQIGTPPREFSILVDSGSSDFWVGSEDCTSSNAKVGCGNHVFLGPSSSSSFEASNDSWSINYVSGAVSGTIVKDDVTIAGLNLPALSFGVANIETRDFTNSGFDGLMGLCGSVKTSNQNNPIPIQVLADANLIKEPVVSYKLGRSADGEGKNDGEITFGGLDPTKFDNTTLITVKSILPNQFWAANLEDVKVNNKSLGFQGRSAILDTGTTLSIIPEADARAIHNQIPGSRFDPDQNFYIIPCDTTAVVSLTFGGRSFDINSTDLSFVPSDKAGECLSGLKPSDSGTAQFAETTYLLGDVFLKNVYLSTNFDTNEISLAELA